MRLGEKVAENKIEIPREFIENNEWRIYINAIPRLCNIQDFNNSRRCSQSIKYLQVICLRSMIRCASAKPFVWPGSSEADMTDYISI